MESAPLQTGIRILLADAQPVTAALLQGLLKEQPDLVVVEVVDRGHTLLSRVCELAPDVDLPGLSCVEIMLCLAARDQAVKMIVLSDDADPSTARAVIRAGISGYLFKDTVVTELVPCIHTVLAGKAYMSPLFG